MTAYDASLIDRLREILAGRRPKRWTGEGRRAAVLAPLQLVDGEVHVVLTKRSEDLRRHRGEMAFPGGGWDPQDGSLERTALREAEEELAIAPEDVEILGRLDDVPTAVSGFVVTPFVGLLPHPYPFKPDGVEIERVVVAPLAWFNDPARVRIQEWERDGVRFPMSFYDIDGDVVWGATARMLGALIALVED